MGKESTSKKPIIQTISKKELEKMVQSSLTMRQVLEKLGLNQKNPWYATNLKHRLKSDNISTGHFNPVLVRTAKLRELNKKRRYDITTKFVKGEFLQNNAWFKKRLVKEGYMEDLCVKCGIGPEWEGDPLTLHLDHIDGDNTNNLLENLRILCPNCHSQTSTWCGRNCKRAKRTYNCNDCGKEISRGASKCSDCVSRATELKPIKTCKCGKQITKTATQCLQCLGLRLRKVKTRPSKEELEKLVKETSYVAVGKRFGVSDNAIRKWLK